MPLPSPFILRPADDLLDRHPHLRHMAAALVRKYAALQAVTDEDLQAMGRALWHALGVDDAFEQARQAAGNAVLPIIVESNSPAVQSLPWETLYHPQHGFLGRARGFALSRRLSAPPPPPQPEPGPLRVLHFTTLPDDLDPEHARLDVEAEQVAVQEALMPYIVAGHVGLESPDDGRWETFQRLLHEFAPHVVFLSGHGRYFHEPHSNEAWSAFLFEDEDGRSLEIRTLPDPQRPEAPSLTAAFRGLPVQLVVLSACESGKHASTDLVHGMALALHRQGIPHVVGMRESLLDAAGLTFARAFFEALLTRRGPRLHGVRVDAALQQARAAIAGQRAAPATHADLHAALSRGQWPLPALWTADPAHPLLVWDFQPQVQAPRREVSVPLGQEDKIPQPPRFIGRRAELRRWKPALRRGQAIRLLITGLGGAGKTTLAAKIARDLAASGFRAWAWSARANAAERTSAWRAFLVELTLALDEDNRARYDALTLGADAQARFAVLLRLLVKQAPEPVVLLLDNLESVQDPDTRALTDPDVAALLQAARAVDGLRLLLTSRWALPDWPEAETLPLRGLAYGDFLALARALALEDPPRFPRAFLAESAKMRRAHAALGGNARHLEWLGAALEDTSPQEEADFLERMEATAAKGREDMTLGYIWERLPADARTLLARIAPAYGSEPVPADGLRVLAPDLPARGRPALRALLARSLLETVWEPRYQAREYRCPEPVQAFLRSRELTDPDPRWAAAAADYRVWQLQHERQGDLGHALRTWEALRRAGRHEEAHLLTLHALAAPLERAGLYRALLPYLQAAARSAHPQTRGTALNLLGKQYHALGDYETALKYYQQSLAISREIGDRSGEGTTLNNIAGIYRARGDYKTALDYLQQSLAILREIGDRSGEGTTLNNISQIYDARGDYETALDYLQQSLAISREIRDRRGEGVTLNNIAGIYDALGDYETALDYLQQSLAIRREIGDRSGEGATLNNIGQIYKARGDYETALKYYQQSLAIRREIGDRSGEGTTLNNISQIYDALGDYETALDYLQQSLAISREIGDRSGEGATLNNIAGIYYARGDYERALKYYQQSLAISREIGDRRGEGTTLNNIGQIYKALGDYETALDYLQQSLAIRREIGDRSGMAYTLFNMGHIHAQKGDLGQALAAWVAVYRLASQMHLAEVLQALQGLGAQLLPQLGLPPDLSGWEQLAQQMAQAGIPTAPPSDDATSAEAEGEALSLEAFVDLCVQAARRKSPEAQDLFAAVRQMSVDARLPAEIRALADVLQRILAGDLSPDLSALPPELAALVRAALEK